MSKWILKDLYLEKVSKDFENCTSIRMVVENARTGKKMYSVAPMIEDADLDLAWISFMSMLIRLEKEDE